MTVSRDDLLLDALLGEADEAALDALLRDDATAQPALDELEELLHAVGAAEAVATPPPALKSRLMASVGGTSRWAPFADRVAAIIDVAVERARDVLAAIEDATRWEAMADGIGLFHLEGGPATAGADVGLVRVAAGRRFPRHTHLGPETVLVLRGGYQDEDGTIVRAGELVTADAGTDHFYTVLEGEDLLYLVVVGGVRFDEAP